jgi:hypothetical protein
MPSSAALTAVTEQIPKLIVRVRFPSPAPSPAPDSVFPAQVPYRPGKAQALADVQAVAVTTDLAEITTALRNTA